MATLPVPLNALRAFEAVARHLSVKKAADELHVTPAAISHQLKLLEELSGRTLLLRKPRGIELTDVARAARGAPGVDAQRQRRALVRDLLADAAPAPLSRRAARDRRARDGAHAPV